MVKQNEMFLTQSPPAPSSGIFRRSAAILIRSSISLHIIVQVFYKNCFYISEYSKKAPSQMLRKKNLEMIKCSVKY